MVRGDRERADEYAIRETLFSPRLYVSTLGFLYHEKFLSFDLGALLSLEQHRTWGGSTRADLLAFSDYNTDLVFFKEKRTNLRLFAGRNNSWVDSPFRTSYRVLSSNLGAEFRIRSIPAPFVISYYRSRTKEDLSLLDRIDKQNQFSLSVRNGINILRSFLSVRYLDFTRNLQPQDYRTFSSSLGNTLYFGKNSPSSLNSMVRYFHQYGTIERRDFSVFESAFLRLSRNIENTMRYQFIEQGSSFSSDSSDALQISRSQRGQVGFKHKLYGSLISSMEVYGSYEEFLSEESGAKQRVGDDKKKGIRADLSYRRKTPWGRLFLGYGYEYAREEQTSRVTIKHVSNESHVLLDGSEPQLEHANVDVKSIVITDETGFIVYQEGIDYTIVSFGAYVRIFRVAGGSIGNGQSIMVDYSYSYSPELSFNATGHIFNFKFDSIRFISLYYRFNRNKEDFISGIPNSFLEDHRRHVTGVKLRAKNLSFGEEYEVNQYLASRFISNRLLADINSRFTATTQLHLNGNYTLTRYANVGRTLNMYILSSRLTTTLSGGFDLEAEGWVRFDRGDRRDPSLDSDFSGIRLKLSKELNAFRFALGAFYRKADDNQVRDERANFYLAMRRSF